MSVQCPDRYDRPEDDCGICHGTGYIICSFPDCGCDGSRLCMAQEPNDAALTGNVEGMWSGKTREQRQAIMNLVGLVAKEKKP